MERRFVNVVVDIDNDLTCLETLDFSNDIFASASISSPSADTAESTVAEELSMVVLEVADSQLEIVDTRTVLMPVPCEGLLVKRGGRYIVFPSWYKRYFFVASGIVSQRGALVRKRFHPYFCLHFNFMNIYS
jgi:hypothetical protein